MQKQVQEAPRLRNAKAPKRLNTADEEDRMASIHMNHVVSLWPPDGPFRVGTYEAPEVHGWISVFV